jgi:urea transport system permease protein
MSAPGVGAAGGAARGTGSPGGVGVTGAAEPRARGAGERLRGWSGPVAFLAAGALLVAGAPAVLDPFRLGLLAKYLCFAVVAVGIALAWGRGGMLVLGQGVFFGIGGYALGMHLTLAQAGPGRLPDFMVWSGVTSLPAIWVPFAHPLFALTMVVVLPVGLATAMGLLVFRRRVRGAYFAILSQALAAAFVILLVGQQGLTGGTNGLTNVTSYFGFQRFNPEHQRGLYVAVVVVLGLAVALVWQLMHSRFGKLLVAVRDGEDRVRFLGYDPALVKTVAYAVAAGLAGVAGALYVPVAGLFSPSLLGVVPSIMMVLMVALGGRHSLPGAVVGAVLVNYAETSLSEAFADRWQYLLGALLVVVILWAPRGLAGLAADLRRAALARLRPRRRGAGRNRPAVPGAAGASAPAPVGAAGAEVAEVAR